MGKLNAEKFIQMFNGKIDDMIERERWYDAFMCCGRTREVFTVAGDFTAGYDVEMAIEHAVVKVKRAEYKAKYGIDINVLEGKDEKDTDD